MSQVYKADIQDKIQERLNDKFFTKLKINNMSNLNKIKEEGNELFNITTSGLQVIRDGKEYIEYKDMKYILDWHNKQMDKAYETGRNDLWETYSKEGGYLLGKKEVIDEVVAGIDEIQKGNTNNGFGRINSLDSLKQKLLSLKNKNN